MVAQEPLDSSLPHSRFMCYTVIWDENDVTEQVSPWDLETVPSAHFKDGAFSFYTCSKVLPHESNLCSHAIVGTYEYVV